MLGAPQAMPEMFPNMFPFGMPQATRHARRVYVGGLPPSANEQTNDNGDPSKQETHATPFRRTTWSGQAWTLVEPSRSCPPPVR
ncbi:hypothetical protein ACLOJK_036700 [Asimina triloba]